MEQTTEYFVIFVRQAGEINPAYSYVTGEQLDVLNRQGIVARYYPVIHEKNHAHTKEEIDALLLQYTTEVGMI